jgi:HEAT repeat protein
MLTFSEFTNLGYNYFVEELNPEQKRVVDSWGNTGKAEEISGHVFPKGQDKISIPLEHPDEDHTPEPHPDIVNHLKKHGYEVKDYKTGTASKAGDKREFKIGKVLNSTGANKDLMHKFTNDPTRQGSKQASSGLHVVISRHPHCVAGMSTNQGWTSCMNMTDGSNKHYLKKDIEHGTHVAYLAHKNDPEAKKPLARIALKPFEPENKKEKTILRPEDRQYGTSDSAFSHTVSNWSEKHFPASDHTIYKKNPNVYHDSGTSILRPFNTSINSSDPDIRAGAFHEHSSKITPEHITKALDDEDWVVRQAAMQHPKATSEHISRALNDEDKVVRRVAISHPKATPEHITKALNDEDEVVRRAAISHPKATHEHITKALNDTDSYVRTHAIQHPKATPEHITKALDDKDWGVRYVAIKHPNVTPEHISKALDNSDEDVRRDAIQHPKATPEHITKALNDEDVGVRNAAIQHPKATPEHISKALGDFNASVKKSAIQHPNVTPEHISKALDDTDWDVRRAAKVRQDHISKALNDKDDDVRHTAKARQEQSTKK